MDVPDYMPCAEQVFVAFDIRHAISGFKYG